MNKINQKKMKKILIIGLSTSLLLILLAFVFSEYANAESFKAKYIKNYDGDTITVKLDCNTPLFCNKMSIRVNGVDTPEIRANCPKEKRLAVKAKEFVKQNLNNKLIELRNCKKGKYFRLICDVFYDYRTNLSSKLIINGYGRKYDGGKRKNWCK